MSEKRTLVIGDTHGHLDRLEYLLMDQGVLGDCPNCDGLGDIPVTEDEGDWTECGHCAGVGLCRVNHDVRVIHIGDLMHGGHETSGGDQDCYEFAVHSHWIDDLIWGNHERGMVDDRHIFGGASRSLAGPTIALMNEMERQGRTYFALAVHDFLLTHAGLGGYWEGAVGNDLAEAADELNRMAADPEKTHHVIHAVSYYRGGRSPAGGILWRDDSEPVSFKFNQVYGHTADREGLHREHRDGDKVAYKIDIGGKYERRLAGIWLPDQTLVRVDLDTLSGWHSS